MSMKFFTKRITEISTNVLANSFDKQFRSSSSTQWMTTFWNNPLKDGE
jgi:hypothetical protein